MAASDVPALVKHTTMAIYEKIKGQPEKERAVSAWNIARARLVEYGYLTKGSESAKSTGVRLTSKGILRNRKHRLEPKNPVIDREFEELFEHIEPIDQKPDKTQGKEPNTTETVSTRQEYPAKQEADATEQVAELLKRTKKQDKQDPAKKKRKDQL